MLNKMDAYNLAVVMGPTLLPIEEKLAPHATHRLTKICELFKVCDNVIYYVSCFFISYVYNFFVKF